ncbi:uncharacterized protein LOC122089747 [Macadamia integrifolia]|uniref:uncharacterized protein LOC122089747 n=1 Tax=Macadamia integrifolia TaxID=60698 RepID=UPI001C4E4D1A|nr:uncharacterized protein LOC122089747 [Macadamia integrifolia]
MLNGGSVGYFGVGRGLRQGDPISPMLFIIAEEVLCRGLTNLVAKKRLKALNDPCGAATLVHSLFTDDIFIFSNASIRYVKNLKLFLSKYEDFSGQKINIEKSKIFLGPITARRKQAIIDVLKIPVCNFPTKYMGMKIFKGRVRKEALLPILDKIKSRLAGWKGNLEELNLPNEEGGLGLRRLRDMNKATLCSLAWRIKHEKSLAYNFLRARFLKRNGSLRPGYRASSIWPGIRKVWGLIVANERWMVGNGRKIDFWKDKWVNGFSVQDLMEDTGNQGPLTIDRFITSFQWNLPPVQSSTITDIFVLIKGVFEAEMEGLMEGLMHAKDMDFLARDAAKSWASVSNVALPGHIMELLSRDANGRPNYRFT